MRRLRPRDRRSGTTAVEAAVIMPVFLLFVFIIFEIGHIYFVAHGLRDACRTGARLGSTDGVTTAECEAFIRSRMSPLIDPSTIDLIIRDASVYDTPGPYPAMEEDFTGLPQVELSDLNPRDVFLIRAQVDYNDVALLPLPFFDQLTCCIAGGTVDPQSYDLILKTYTLTRHE